MAFTPSPPRSQVIEHQLSPRGYSGEAPYRCPALCYRLLISAGLTDREATCDGESSSQGWVERQSWQPRGARGAAGGRAGDWFSQRACGKGECSSS